MFNRKAFEFVAAKVGLLVLWAVISTSANADELVVDDGAKNSRPVASDQPELGNIWNSMAQTFTAQWPRIEFGFRILNWELGPGAGTILPDAGEPIILNLYGGEHDYSILLATRTVTIPDQVSTDPRSTWGDVGFVMADFSAVELTVGGRYTVEITLPESDFPITGQRSNISVWTSLEDPYAGGRFYFPSGNPVAVFNPYFEQDDMLFRMVEVVESSPVGLVELLEASILAALDGEGLKGTANSLLAFLEGIQARVEWLAANQSSPDAEEVVAETCSRIDHFNDQMDLYVRLDRLSASYRGEWGAIMSQVAAAMDCSS